MIAREGWVPLAGMFLCTIFTLVVLGPLWSIPCWLGCVVVYRVFREPLRHIPSLPLAIVSPADGRIASVGETPDPFLRRDSICIEIGMRAPGISSLRSPTEGKVTEFWTGNRGATIDTQRDSPPFGNRSCYALSVQTDEGDDVVTAVSTNAVFSRFKSDVAPGERIGQGHRSGFVYFGTTVNVYVPPNARCEVTPGEGILAGSGVLATLVHP